MSQPKWKFELGKREDVETGSCGLRIKWTVTAGCSGLPTIFLLAQSTRGSTLSSIYISLNLSCFMIIENQHERPHDVCDCRALGPVDDLPDTEPIRRRKMPRNRVRIWNSEIAYRVDSQLDSRWDRAVFRQLLSQNDLHERQLLYLLRRWRAHGHELSFCQYLTNAGLLSVELRNQFDWAATRCDSENVELHVTLTPQAIAELRTSSSRLGRAIQFLITMLANLIAKLGHPKREQSAADTQATMHPITLLSTEEPKVECSPFPAATSQCTSAAPRTLPVTSSPQEFDPYATIC